MLMRRGVLSCACCLLLLQACDCGGPPPAGVDAAVRRYDGGQPDRGDPDATSMDLTAADSTAPDVTTPDSAADDATVIDAAPVDATPVDAASVDSGGLDAAVADVVGADLPGADSASVDAALPDTSAPDQLGPDAAAADAGCTSDCAAQGASRCQGDAVITCELQGGCLRWSAPVACSGDTSCSDGRCRSVCSDECTVTGATRCQSTTVVESCGQFDADSCLEWGAAVSCPQGDVCSVGACSAACRDACSAPGARRCSGQSVEQCGDPDGDSCLGWSLVATCSEAESCSLGVCAPRCVDECSSAGARECDGQGYRVCGNHDLDACLEWGTSTACAPGTTCSGGVCQASCLNECGPAGALGCQANAWRSCGNYDLDACLEWSTGTTCPAGTACSNGVCALTCTDECGPAGSVGCAGTGTRHCANYDLDPCLEWSDVTPCLSGTTCSSGVCQPTCSDECASGEHQCAGSAAIQACATNFDADACWDWGPPAACPVATPTCVETSPGQAACSASCSDACPLATPVACHDGQSTIACVVGASTCNEWRITACGTGKACMGSSCVTCTADGLEANDSADQARLLGSLPYTSATLSLCAPDEDWFAVDLAAGQTLEVTLRFAHALGDVDLHVMDAGQQNVVRSISVTDDEHARFYSATGGRVLIHVFGFLGDSNTYTLELGLYQCTDDGNEPDDLLGDATLLPAAPSSVGNLELCPGDEDWFAVELAQGDSVRVDLVREAGVRDVVVDLHSGDGTLLASGTATGDGERLLLNGYDPGTYYLRVYGLQGASGGYGLQLSGYVCQSDAYEPNNAQVGAPVLTQVPATLEGLWLCNGDEDWFLLDVEAGDDLQVALRFVDAAGDIDLRVFTEAGVQLGSSLSTTDDELIVLHNLAAGRIGIRVFSFYDIDNGYTLELSRPPPCPRDPGEPNESDQAATPIASIPYSASGLHLCLPDEDWYTFTPAAGQNVQVDLQFAHALGNLDLTVYDSALATLAYGWSVTDNERVTLFNTKAEPYYLVVDTIGSLSNSYGLTLTAVPGCSSDPLEDNNTSSTATVVLGLPLQRDDLSICGSDQDWFKVTALAGDSMRFAIAFVHAQADLDLELFDASLQAVAASKSADDDELITVTGMAAQSYYLKVSAFDLRSAPYTLRISRP